MNKSNLQLEMTANTLTNKETFIKPFYHNQIHYNYKLDKNILKTLIKRNILYTDPNKKTYIQ